MTIKRITLIQKRPKSIYCNTLNSSKTPKTNYCNTLNRPKIVKTILCNTINKAVLKSSKLEIIEHSYSFSNYVGNIDVHFNFHMTNHRLLFLIEPYCMCISARTIERRSSSSPLFNITVQHRHLHTGFSALSSFSLGSNLKYQSIQN